MKTWKFLDSKKEKGGRIFAYETQKFQSQDTGKIGNFDVLKFADWVNIVALTKNKELVVIRQFRVGLKSITLEIPGGAIDPGEDPLEAAKRELEEETGYRSKTWHFAGKVNPNPAFMDNVYFTYVAENCEQTSRQNLDPLEEIEVDLIKSSEINNAVLEGKIDHSIVITALFFAQKWLD